MNILYNKLSYSIEDSKKNGFRKEDNIKRPVKLYRKKRVIISSAKDKYKKRVITLADLLKAETINNKLVKVYVESSCGNVAIVRDESAIIEIDMNNTYAITGKFVFIQISKKKNKIKVKKIIRGAKWNV